MVLNYDITEPLTISRIKYAAPSRCGFANNEHIKQLQSLLNKLIRINYLPPNYPKIKAIFASLDVNVCSQELPITRTMHSIRSSHLPSLHPMICEDERTITPKQFNLRSKTKHSFLVFSILNKLIILIVHRF